MRNSERTTPYAVVRAREQQRATLALARLLLPKPKLPRGRRRVIIADATER